MHTSVVFILCHALVEIFREQVLSFPWSVLFVFYPFHQILFSSLSSCENVPISGQTPLSLATPIINDIFCLSRIPRESIVFTVHLIVPLHCGSAIILEHFYFL